MTSPKQHPASNSDARKRLTDESAYEWPEVPVSVSTAMWAEVIREACANAWDEGLTAGRDALVSAAGTFYGPEAPNPYRSES